MSMTMTHEERRGRHVATVGGDIGRMETHSFRQHLFDGIDTSQSTLVIDLHAVSSMCDGAVAVLVGCRRRLAAHGRRLVLVDDRGAASSAIRSSGMDHTFIVRTTVDEAVLT